MRDASNGEKRKDFVLAHLKKERFCQIGIDSRGAVTFGLGLGKNRKNKNESKVYTTTFKT